MSGVVPTCEAGLTTVGIANQIIRERTPLMLPLKANHFVDSMPAAFSIDAGILPSPLSHHFPCFRTVFTLYHRDEAHDLGFLSWLCDLLAVSFLDT